MNKNNGPTQTNNNSGGGGGGLDMEALLGMMS